MLTCFPNQQRAIPRALQAIHRDGGYYLMHDPGMGKTLSALLIAHQLGAERILILGPVVSLGVWQREAYKWLGEEVCIVRASEGRPTGRIVITNYEQITGEFGAPRLRMLLSGQPDFLILDEAQAIKTPSSQTRRSVERIAKRTRYKLLLSGTSAHSPLDWWVPMRMLVPNDPWWEQRFTDYRAKIAVLDGPNNLWVRSFRPAQVAEAKRRMAPHIDVATIDELKLPKPLVTPTTFPLAPIEARQYAQMDKVLRAELAENKTASAELILTKLLRLHQMTGGHVTADDGTKTKVGDSKLRALKGLLAQRRHQKVLIACRFRWEVEAVLNVIGFREAALGKLEPEQMTHVGLSITGDTPQAERRRIEELFQSSPHPIALVLQYKAGGVSLTLSKARALIFYSFDPSVIAFRQMIGRIWRPGLEGAWQMIPLMAANTIDEKLWQGLRLGYTLTQLARSV